MTDPHPTLNVLSQPQPQALGSNYRSANTHLQQARSRRYLMALGMTLLTALFLTLPTSILPNPIFAREVPIRWWEYPVVAATCALTWAWFMIQTPPKQPEHHGRLLTALTVTLFAVACPVCNKIVLLTIGAAGAMSTWAPIQPYLALITLVALGLALVLRVRSARLGAGTSLERRVS